MKNNGPDSSQFDKQCIGLRISAHSNQGKEEEIHVQTHHSQLLKPTAEEEVLKAYKRTTIRLMADFSSEKRETKR